MKILNHFFLILLLLSISTFSYAIVIDNGKYTTDTESGLDWLDVTESVDMSFDYVSSQFGTGGEFSGWRYATASELDSLIINYGGIAGSGFNLYAEQDESVTGGLISLLGSTFDEYYLNLDGQTYYEHTGVNKRYTTGILADTISGLNHYTAKIFNRIPSIIYPLPSESYTELKGNIMFYVAKSKWGGSFLVRDSVAAVDEPASFILMVLGLLGFIVAHRNSKAI